MYNQKLQAEHAGPEVLVTLTSPSAYDGSLIVVCRPQLGGMLHFMCVASA